MMLTLSPFAVDSLTPSYRHNQHPPRAPIPHHVHETRNGGREGGVEMLIKVGTTGQS